MDTTKKGNQFEDASFELISDSINSGKLGLIPSQCKVFKKKGYYSKDRDDEIVFDLTIEVWAPKADRFTLLWIIECKSLKGKVPVDDVEEFHSKINQVSELNTKGVMISENGFQKGAFKLAKSLGLMLIQLNYDDTGQILLHRIHRSQESQPEEDMSSLLTEIFNARTRVTGLDRYSGKKIESISQKFLEEFNPDILDYARKIPIDQLIEYVRDKFRLGTDLSGSLGTNDNGHDILGFYSRKDNRICIDKSVVGSERFPFIFAHELGHFVLHNNLKMNQKEYDLSSDSIYNFRIGKHILTNDKNWIEWQANHFAATLILPSSSLLHRLVRFQYRQGIPHKGRIYVDNQLINKIDYNETITFLSSFFGVTKTSVIFRLKEMGILEFEDSFKQVGNIGILNYL